MCLHFCFLMPVSLCNASSFALLGALHCLPTLFDKSKLAKQSLLICAQGPKSLVLWYPWKYTHKRRKLLVAAEEGTLGALQLFKPTNIAVYHGIRLYLPQWPCLHGADN